MKTNFIIIALIFCCYTVLAQTANQHIDGIEKSKKKNTAFISMDTVYISGEPFFNCKTHTEQIAGSLNGGWTYYTIFNFRSKDTLIEIKKLGSALFKQFSVVFPQVKYCFDAGNSWSQEKLIKEMYEEKVFADNTISVQALKAFGVKNNLKIMTLDEYSAWVKQYEAEQAAIEAERKAKEGIVNIKNNSYATITLSIIYPEGTTYLSVPANGTITFNQGEKKGQMCIKGGNYCAKLPFKSTDMNDKGFVFIKKDGSSISSFEW